MELQLLSDQRVVLSATPATGGAPAIFLVNGGFAEAISNLNLTEQSVSTALNSACTSLTEQAQERTAAQQDLLDTCEGLLDLSDAEASEVISSLAPDEIIAQADVSMAVSNQQVSGVSNRLNALRSGGLGALDLSLIHI